PQPPGHGVTACRHVARRTTAAPRGRARVPARWARRVLAAGDPGCPSAAHPRTGSRHGAPARGTLRCDADHRVPSPGPVTDSRGGATVGSGLETTAIEIADAVRRGERRATEVLDEALAAVDAGNERLGAFVHVDEGLARAAAEAVDAEVAAGRDPGPFAGVPIGVKDLEDCAG